MGFDVVRVKFPHDILARLAPDPFAESGYRIEVDNKGHILCQCWIVLHETGHYFLHTRLTPACAKIHRQKGLCSW